MQTLQKYLVLPALLAGLLAGCATDNTPKPTPLSKVAPEAIQISTVWSKSVGNGNDNRDLTLGSTLQNDTLISASVDGEVTALNLLNHAPLWHTDIGHSISATPAINSSMVFVGTRDGYLYALDLSTGKIDWKAALPSLILGAPAATDDVVVVQAHDASVEAFATDSGKKLWSYQATQPTLTLYSNSSPLIANNMVYVGFDSGQLGAFDLYRGVETWQVPIAVPTSTEAVQNMVDIDGTPVLDSNALFVTSYHGTIAAVNSSNGQIIWQRVNSSFEAPVVQNGKVIAVTETGTIQAFDESTGALLWQQKDLQYRFISPPAVINDEVVVGDYAGYVHFLSLDSGDLLARVKVSSSGIKAQPLIYNNQVLITSNNGDVIALQPSS